MEELETTDAEFSAVQELGGLHDEAPSGRESARLLSLTSELATIGTWRLDVAAGALHWSDTVYEIHGVTRETYRPEIATAIEFYHPDDRDHVQRCVDLAIAERRDFDFQLRLVRADGAIRQVISKGRLEFDDEGALCSIIGIFQDITELQAQEQDLRRSHARLRAHIENTPLAVIEWDRDFRVVEWNSRCEEMFGYSREEALGLHATDLVVPKELYGFVSEVFDGLLAQTGGTHSSNDNITKSGKTISCEWYNTPLLDADGIANGVASIVQDVTERKALAEQLVQSQKMEAIGTLAGGIAHDMNNVLAVVLGLGSVVEEDLPEGSEMREDMQDLLAAASRGKAMVTNLLGFARKGDYARTRWAPAPAIEKIVELLRKTIPKEISTECTVAEDVGDIVADANQIASALMNLCINASQAIQGSGSIRIVGSTFVPTAEDRITLKQLTGDSYVRIDVIDDGQGMDEATCARACEPFFTTKGVGGGTGLGLSMVYGAVDNHGGTMSIRSKAGQGTTVSIFLPTALDA